VKITTSTFPVIHKRMKKRKIKKNESIDILKQPYNNVILIVNNCKIIIKKTVILFIIIVFGKF